MIGALSAAPSRFIAAFMTKRTETIHVRTTPEVQRVIEQVADAQRRSVSSMAEVVLAEWAKGQQAPAQAA